jgi:hypothetical protein
MPKEPIDITPADSAVPVFLVELTDEELAQRETEYAAEQVARQAEQESKAAQKAAILERIGLTEEELQIVLGA